MSNESVVVEQQGAIRLISVDDGRANAFSPNLTAAIAAEVSAAEADEGTRAAVISGRATVFSAGFDLNIIKEGDPVAIRAMVAAGGALVRQCYGASIPIVAASRGHAVAAGALLLLGCDQRVGSDGPVKIGLNEVAIAMTLPGWALAIARERLSKRYLQRCVVNAHLVDGSGAVDAGFLDEVLPADEVVERAIAIATDLAGSLDPGAYAGTVKAMRSDVLAEMDASVAHGLATSGNTTRGQG
jgi:enoyl-CoA hydratase